MKNMVLLRITSVEKGQQHFPFSLFLSFFGAFFSSSFHGLFFFLFVRSLIPTCGGIIVSIILSSLGQCSNNDDHHTFIFLQLNITTRYLEQIMTLYECLWWYTGICNDLAKQRFKKNGQAMKTSCQLSYDHAKQYDNDGACHNKRNGGSCMAIYLGMAMEMS